MYSKVLLIVCCFALISGCSNDEPPRDVKDVSSKNIKTIVAPKITIPICNGVVPTRRDKNVSGGFKNKVNKIPKNIDTAALPTYIAIITTKAKIRYNNLDTKYLNNL